MRAFHIWGNENGENQQQNDGYIYRIGVGIVDAAVEKQDAETDYHSDDNPHHLLAREQGKLEDSSIVELVAGGIDAHHTTHHENGVEHHSEPVDVAQWRVVAVIVCCP